MVLTVCKNWYMSSFTHIKLQHPTSTKAFCQNVTELAASITVEDCGLIKYLNTTLSPLGIIIDLSYLMIPCWN